MSTVEHALHAQLHLLYSDHHGWLLAWLRRKLGCPHQAADVAQNTFLRALTQPTSPAEWHQPRAWLTTTAQRLIVDAARRRALEQAYLAELSALAADHDTAPSPEELLAAVQMLTQLCAVLEAVSANARIAFVRHYLDGETHAVIAADLDVSTRMVQKYLAQVLVQASRVGARP